MLSKRLAVPVVAALTGFAVCASADDNQKNSDAAVAAAKQILQLTAENKLNTLWDKHMSAVYKKVLVKDVFMQNLSMGRAQVGPQQSAKISAMAYLAEDQGVKGDIYTITFETQYPAGKFFERVAVIKEGDGVFRLCGLWGAPAPRD